MTVEPRPTDADVKTLADLPTVSGESFRNCIARLPSGVHVVTTDGPAGRGGFTATAVASVSDDPPTVLVCLNRASSQAGIFAANGRFAVNLMAADAVDVADVFAGRQGHRGEARFGHGTWTTLATGAPVLEGAVMTLDCRLVDSLPVASHTIFIGEVVATAVAAPGEGGGVLIYHDRRYDTVSPAANQAAR